MLSREEVDGSKYAYVVDKGLPDHILEFFWYGFKDSIYNAVTIDNVNTNLKNFIICELEKKRKVLNQLQKEAKYDQIFETIQEFIIWISQYLMIPKASHYHFSIYLTNVKRWSKWVLKQGGSDDWLKKNNADHFYVFFELKKYVMNKMDTSSKLVDLIERYVPEKASNNLSTLHQIMEHLVDADLLKPILLDTLKISCPVLEYLKEREILPKDLEAKKQYSFAKLLKKYGQKKMK